MGRLQKTYHNKDLALLLKKISINLRQYRLAKDITQKELARKSQLATSTIIEIENNQANDIKLLTICNIAKALKLKTSLELLK